MNDYSGMIRKIEAGGFTEQELLNLYVNAQERQADDVLAAVTLQLRERFTRTANRLFGAKQGDAQATLQAVLDDLSAKFDLSANKVGRGVKTGGDMIAGRKYLDLYISYKNAAGEAGLLALVQEEASSELMVCVRTYRTGREAFAEERFQPVAELRQSVALYEERLRAIVP
jgi:hypothetical protein